MPSIDVVIVGAGPAGLGMALTLSKLSGIRYAVLEADRIGASFRKWPVQTRFITPSFHSNPFGLADLNAIDSLSSPAIAAGSEHPGGDHYARYLQLLADGHTLPIVEGCKVLRVEPASHGGFDLVTEQGELHARFLIWATGEYQFPELDPFPGANLCIHYAQVEDWQTLQGAAHTVIGGYESGVDAAVQLVRLGHYVRLLARKSTWDPQGPHDPSLSLSPYSRERLYNAIDTGRLEIVFGVDVVSVTSETDGAHRIHARDGRSWNTPSPPILGTGFLKGGGAQQIADLWHWDEQGRIALSDTDESTRCPGLFLVGPQVRHDALIYCFVYKFRQRFALVARDIAARLQLDATPLATGAGSWGPFGNSDCCEGCEC